MARTHNVNMTLSDQELAQLDDSRGVTPRALEAAAVASPDEKRGHVVKAFLVLAEGREPSDELANEIKLFVRGHLSAYAYPRKISFVNELPKTLTGKIRRIELREEELSGSA